jgi:FkbM family methyltransferase
LNIVAEKLRQIGAFYRDTATPLSLSLDAVRIKRSEYVAISKDGLKLKINANCGEGFTFYENLIRRDYLRNGIALGPGSTVVDIGANIGSFAILAGSIVGPGGRVLAFEPMPETFERLLENVALNELDNVECHRAAIDAEEGTLTLKLARKNALVSAHGVNAEETSEGSVTAPCLGLRRVFEDNQIDRIHLLKIDCEGSEYGIFETLAPELAARIDQIAMEIHPVRGKTFEGLRLALEGLGFEVRCDYPWVAINVAARGLEA